MFGWKTGMLGHSMNRKSSLYSTCDHRCSKTTLAHHPMSAANFSSILQLALPICTTEPFVVQAKALS
jgi:hypothetical protein